MVTAAAQDQWRLLDVQAHDTKLAQLAHRRRSLPEHAEVQRLEARLAGIGDELVVARTAAGDIARELAKAEADVEQVRNRAARDRSRLEAGSGPAKELQALQSELEALTARQSVLEDVELEVMERQEAADAAVTSASAEAERVTAELAGVRAALEKALAGLDDEIGAETRARADAVAGVPAPLVELYEKIRQNAGGLGAARLYQRRCEGCRLELTPVDLGRIRAAAEDEVVRCEECRRILVRTPDSGL